MRIENGVKLYKTSPEKRARNKKHYMTMLAEGRCVDCGKSDALTLEGRSRCAICNANHKRPPRKPRTEDQREKENAEKRAWAQKRKEAHVCVYCGTQDKRTLNGMSSCLCCAKSRRDKRRENRDTAHEKELREARTQRRREAGLCTVCGGKRDDPGYAMCVDCRVRWKMRKLRRKIETGWLPRGANGTCYQCNSAPAIEGKKLCKACYDRKIETLRKNSRHPWKGEGRDDD